MTRLQILTKAFPDLISQIQRYVKEYPDPCEEQDIEEFLSGQPTDDETPGGILSGCFVFGDTPEGHEHWARLAKAHGWLHGWRA